MKLFFASMLCILALQGRALAAPIDVIFDIDWTTFYSIAPETAAVSKQDATILEVEGKFYRPTDHLGEVLFALSKNPDVRISFFSGGEASRNNALLEKVILPNGKNALSVVHAVFSKGDLETVSQDQSLKFSDRFKKNPANLLPGFDAKRAILIDDQIQFAKAPLKAVPSLGNYNFQSQFDAQRVNLPYMPSDEFAWKHERDKALMWQSLIEEAMERSQKSEKSFSEIVVQLWAEKSSRALCRTVFAL
ncbi:hypothetical protein [Bdellovibrio sp. NC01]|uniref:hypothetical protein n=1 Tax=Bdellovibrio sp. NC01 TaxID=2220073 RepID=UPI0011598EEE|nr:hypothetical protein [Bdellovibrio sp. NC01]QDK38924.1 hypothetical protein DOE51_15685 [Bdellovibrio sp. NC01]